jgi:hypothetical protein
LRQLFHQKKESGEEGVIHIEDECKCEINTINRLYIE